MIYVQDSEVDAKASLLPKGRFTSYRSARIDGDAPQFLIELPVFSDEGVINGSFPIMDSGYNKLLEFRGIKPSALNTIPTWIIYPEISSSGDKNWTSKKVAEIWEGSWRRDDAECRCSRIKCADGSDFYLGGSQPADRDAVTWTHAL